MERVSHIDLLYRINPIVKQVRDSFLSLYVAAVDCFVESPQVQSHDVRAV